jgi:hypothetical protein
MKRNLVTAQARFEFGRCTSLLSLFLHFNQPNKFLGLLFRTKDEGPIVFEIADLRDATDFLPMNAFDFQVCDRDSVLGPPSCVARIDFSSSISKLHNGDTAIVILAAIIQNSLLHSHPLLRRLLCLVTRFLSLFGLFLDKNAE